MANKYIYIKGKGILDNLLSSDLYLVSTTSASPSENFIPLQGTEMGNPVTGDIEFDGVVRLKDSSSNKAFIFSPIALVLSVTDSSEDKTSVVSSTQSGFELYHLDNVSGAVKQILGQLGDNRGIVIRDEENEVGITGEDNYSSNYLDNSYVQKIYVDSQVGAITSNFSVYKESFTYSGGDNLFNLSFDATNAILVTVNGQTLNPSSGAPVQYQINALTELQLLDDLEAGDIIHIAYTSLLLDTATYSKTETDTLLLLKQDKREIKTIASTNYTIVVDDINKILHFTASSPVTVTVPSGLPINSRYEGKQLGTGQLTFTPSGTTLNKGTSENLKTAEQYSVFGLDWIGSETYMLFGKLELA